MNAGNLSGLYYFMTYILTSAIITLKRGNRVQDQFSRALCNVVASWSKMKTCQTRLLSKSNFLGFLQFSSGLEVLSFRHLQVNQIWNDK